MKWTFRFIDLAETQPPSDFIAKAKSENWVYLVALDPEPLWHQVMSGDAVHVPMQPYCTYSKNPAIAMSYAFQMGADAMLSIANLKIEQAHLSVGTPVEEVTNYIQPTPKSTPRDCFRIWLGLAVRFKPP